MKEPGAKRPKTSKQAGTGRRGAPGPASGAAPIPLTTGRKWLFSLVGFVVLPVLLLAGVEMALRVAGVGYSTDFFKRVRIGQEDYLVGNDSFGLRFFPPELVRLPPPVVMKADKGPGVYRIFLLGESAALGDPRPAYGAGRYLQALLQERYPDRRFEVVCGAVTAINSHALLPIARECARHQGDLWIIYMGNNEMVGPFGATTVFGSQTPPLWMVRLTLAVQQTRLGQSFIALARKLGGAARRAPSWGGMQMFVENRIAPGDARKEVVYRSFRRNLEDMLAAGRHSGVPVILSTVAVNLKDCSPFGSLLDAGLTSSAREAYAARCAEGVQAEAAGNLPAAAAKFEQSAAIAPRSAEVQYRWGRCLLDLAGHGVASSQPGQALTANPGDSLEAARAHLEEARDDDALPFRTDSRLNAIITQAALEHAGSGLDFFDAARFFATNSPAGVPGRETFFEHVHFNWDGNYRLGRAWAAEVARFLPSDATNHARADWASQAVCERRLGLTGWNRYEILEDVLQRLSQPPFTGQLDHTQQVGEVRGELRALRAGLDRAAAERARETYLAALRLDPEDHYLHENFAQFLEAVGDLAGAEAQWQRVRELLPQHHVAYFQAGRILVREGRLQDGRALLEQSVRMRPDLAEGWLELGNIHTLEDQPALALEQFERARRLTPRDPRAYYQIARALLKLNRKPEALDDLRQALDLRPDYWEAHYALGEELAFSGQHSEARKEFEEVLRLKPDYAMAHLNLGVALAQEGDLDGALAHLEEAVRLDPKNEPARQTLEKVRVRRTLDPGRP